jgi:hypothetical protein
VTTASTARWGWRTPGSTVQTYALLWLAKIYAWVGEEEAALDRIDKLLAIPSELSPAMLRLDPDWDPLRANPRFKMLAETDS